MWWEYHLPGLNLEPATNMCTEVGGVRQHTKSYWLNYLLCLGGVKQHTQALLAESHVVLRLLCASLAVAFLFMVLIFSFGLWFSMTYIVEVESFCIGSQCLGKTIFHALVDSGSSFTSLPDNVYKRVTTKFDRQVNASRLVYSDSPWEYCYKASPLEMPEIPTLTLMFSVNKSFVANSPVHHVYGEEGDLAGFCLALQSSSDSMGIIGQNFMTGYRIVFDRENLKLGWSQSNCHDLDNSRSVHLTPPPQNRPENPLPTDEQQSSPKGRAVAPAVAGRTPPTNPSAASPQVVTQYCLLLLLTQVAVMFIG